MRIPTSRRLIFLAILTCLVLTALFFPRKWNSTTTVQPTQKIDAGSTTPNVILLMLDCVRADHVSAYGYNRKTTPTIDALASGGVIFRNAISQAPWTKPSVFSFLSGLYPFRNGEWKKRDMSRKQKKIFMASRKTTPFLPDFFKAQGYHTWGFSTNPFINNKRSTLTGFDELRYQWKAPAMEVVNYGREKIRQAEKEGSNFFLYLHFMDTHHPIWLPDEYYNYFPTNSGKKNTPRHRSWEFSKFEEQKGPDFKNYKEHKTSVYDGSIRYIDSEIGHLLRELRHARLSSDTIIAIIADHGEELWDHSEYEANYYKSTAHKQGIGHGHTLFQELIHVPFIISRIDSHGKFKPLYRTTPVKEYVQLTDLAPTILDLTGFQSPDIFEGVSLAPLMSRQPAAAAEFNKRLLFSEIPRRRNRLIALIEFPYKYIYSEVDPDTLFNLMTDPLETRNLLTEEPSRAQKMLETIEHYKEGKSTKPKEEKYSPEDIEKLKALGYIE